MNLRATTVRVYVGSNVGSSTKHKMTSH
jgi:hypothetical protein